jgi:ABC-type branched-subunit amino acid transport system substrate-binding protein
MRRSAFGVALVATALLLAACAGTSTSSDTEEDGGRTTGEGASAELSDAPGFDASTNTIRLGALYPMSGNFAGNTQAIVAMEAYFSRVTADGGPLEGFTIEISSADTQFDPAVALPQYQDMKDDVVMFAGILGTGIVHTLREQLAADQLVAVPAAYDSEFVYDPNLVPIFSPWEVYSANAIAYAAENLADADGTVFCSLTQDDDLGAAMQRGVDHATETLGLTVGAQVPFPFGNEDFTGQVTQLKEAGCGVVMVAGGGPVMVQSAVRAVQLDFEATWMNTSASFALDIANGPGAEYLREHAWFVHANGGGWEERVVEGQTMLLDDLAEHFPDAEPGWPTYQYGYVGAIAAAAVLQKAVEAGDLGRESVLEAAQSLGTVDYFGLGGGQYAYGGSVSEREPPRTVTIHRVSPNDPVGIELVEAEYTSEAGDTYPVEP